MGTKAKDIEGDPGLGVGMCRSFDPTTGAEDAADREARRGFAGGARHPNDDGAGIFL